MNDLLHTGSAPDCYVTFWSVGVVVIVVCLLGFCGMLWAVQRERKQMQATWKETQKALDEYRTLTGGT